MFDRTRHVLYVDDDPTTSQLLAMRLKPHGFEVAELNEPERTLDTLRGGPWRVALLDIVMPQVNGLELLRQIKAHDAGIQVIMLTALVDMQAVLDSLRFGAEACFFKPLKDESELVEALEAVFRKFERWWDTLDELARERRRPIDGSPELAATIALGEHR